MILSLEGSRESQKTCHAMHEVKLGVSHGHH